MFKTFKIIACTALLSFGLVGCAKTSTPPPETGFLSAKERHTFDTAIAHYQNLLQQKPGKIEAILGLSRNLRWAGRGQEALTLLEKHRDQFAFDGHYLAELGKVNLVQGQNVEGVNFLEQATLRISDDWRLYSALGIGLDHQKSFAKAEVAYRKALEMCPDDSAVINNLAISQGLSGRIDQAIITLQRALSYGTHTTKIKRNLALFTDARDLCANCGASYINKSSGMILAAGLKATDKEGPCSPEPAYVAKVPIMVQQLAPEAKLPSINIKVYFEFDSAILKPETLTILDNLGQALTFGALNNYRFEIAGHTDAVGSNVYNQSLSERRAKSVLKYLQSTFSIDPNRIDAVGYGESRLLDPRQPDGDVNRRVQVTRLSKIAPN